MTTEATVASVGLVPLANVENNVLVEDMNYRFHYERVKKPDGNPSNYFALHYREEQQEQWSSCKNLLTNVFTVAKTEAVIAQIQESLEGNVENEHHYRSDTSVKSSFTLSGYQIDVEPESEVDLVLFKLITNIDADTEMISSAGLTFNLINGFSGNHALSLAFGLLKTMRTQVGDDTKIIPINNVFLLDSFTKRLIHDNHLSISIEDVTNVQQAIQNRINAYKSQMFTTAIMDEIMEKLPKKFGKKFIALFDNLPEPLRNFYYVTYIFSVLLDGERNIALEIKLKSMISEMVEPLITAANTVEA